MNLKKTILPFVLCLISGIAMGVCLLFPQIGPAVFLLAVPALAVIQKKTTKKQRFWHCFAFTGGICLAAYFPAFSIQVDIEPIYAFVVNLALYAVLFVVHGGIMALVLWLGHQLKLPKGFGAVCVALFWAGGEWLLGFGPFAWPTARISLALWQYPIFFRSASLGGQLLVSGLILGVNYLLARAVCCWKTKQWLVRAGIAVFMVVANVTVGICYPAPSPATTSVAVIQPGGQAVDTNRGTVYTDCLALAQQTASEKPRLILLPEGILPSTANASDSMQSQWGNIAKQAEADLLVGGFREGLSTVIQFDSNGNRIFEYKKIKEVPFFENGQGKAFVFFSKTHASVLTSNCGKIGNLICYESMFSSLAQNSVRDGAQLLFVSTNDSWFTASVAKNIHLAHGAYRGVETGRTLVQSSIDGCSAVFDAAGNMTHSMPHKTKGVMQAKVSFDPMDTLYNHIGDWWLAGGLLIMVLLSVWCAIRKKWNKNN